MEYDLKGLKLPVRFTSPSRRYAICLKPTHRILVDGKLYAEQGIHIQFDDWQAVVDNPEAVHLLIKHEMYGREFTCPKLEEMKERGEVGHEAQVPGAAESAGGSSADTGGKEENVDLNTDNRSSSPADS